MGAGTRPLGIMVSHCADHAIRAFAEGAIDYFVMPVTAERFDLAMARARHRFNYALPGHGRFASGSSELGRTAPVSPRFLVGERQRRLYPLDPRSIDYIEADGNYVTLRAGKVEYLSRDSIKRLSMQLAELGFIRIERSLLVNAAAVSYAEVAGHGTFALTLSSGVCLHSSAALPRFDFARHPAAGLVEALPRHCVVEDHSLQPAQVCPVGRLRQNGSIERGLSQGKHHFLIRLKSSRR